MRRIMVVLSAVVLLAGSVLGANLWWVHRPMSEAIASDPRNEGLVFWAHYERFVVPGAIVIDLRDAALTKSPADVFRLVLQFAARQKDRQYDRVVLSFRGEPRFQLSGNYFSQLGREYGVQNPVYTMRTFAENVRNLDGSPAFGSWTGGILGVLGKQIEDFREFHKRWYLRDLALSAEPAGAQPGR